jgi:alkylhydroperoxidase family enzyme
LIDAIKKRRWRELNALSARNRALCQVADKMSAMPARMSPADWKPLRGMGFDDRILLEVAHVVGIFNCLTRLADGFGLRIAEAIEVAGRTGIPLKRAGK